MAMQAEIQEWCPPSTPLHPEHTVAFIVTKAYIPPPRSHPNIAQLEAQYLILFLGNGNADEYEDRIPDFPNPLVTALGTMCGPTMVLSTGHHTFAVLVKDYVRDKSKSSVIQ